MIQAPPVSAFLTKPDIHGEIVVFTAEGDLWLGDLKAKAARRLTRDPGVETDARFSPDGRTLAFTAEYDGSRDVWVMPAEGGEPRRLTWEPAGAQVQGWSPDGKSVLFRSSGDGQPPELGLFTVPAAGGMPTRLPVPRAEMGRLGPDGRLVYVPVSNEWANWFKYKGGAADDLWLADLKGSFRRLTTEPTVETSPVWCGRSVFYAGEASGSFNLWRLDPETGKSTIVTKNLANPVRAPSSDGKRVVFQAGPTIALHDPARGSVTPLRFEMAADRLHTIARRLPIADNLTGFAPGPTGKRVLLAARGQILSVPTEEGETRVLEATAKARAVLPVWSPDATTVAFVSDRTGENELWTVPAEGGEARRLTTGLKANPVATLYSPDGKKIALQDRDGRTVVVDGATGKMDVVDEAEYTYSYDSVLPQMAFSPDSSLLAITAPTGRYLYSVAVIDLKTGRRWAASPEGIAAYAPAFSPDGRTLAYLSERDVRRPVTTMANMTGQPVFVKTIRVNLVPLDAGAPSPFLTKSDGEASALPKPETKPDAKPETPAPRPPMDGPGLLRRLYDAPVPSGEYVQMDWTGDRLLLLDRDGGKLSQFHISEKKVKALTEDVVGFVRTADGKRLLLNVAGRPKVMDLTPGAEPKAVPVAGTVTVEPAAEWAQIMEETGRLARDLFYDPGLHGVDWNEVRARYRAQLPMVGDRSDLTRLLKDMVSELRSGHAYMSAAPIENRRANPGFGFLGADLVPAPGGVKIARILRGDDFDLMASPLAAPGLPVREGDVIIAVDGRPVRTDRDPRSLLVGAAGRVLALTISSGPGDAGTRTVRVKPHDLAAEKELRLQDWVARRRAYVVAKAGPNFGYLYVPDMTEAGMTGAIKGLLPNAEKDAVVVDLRFNGGGNISTVLDWMWAQRPMAWWKPRSGGTWTRENWSLRGHLAALINEDNFSDGELVVSTWQKLKLGPVVGKRTGGGEVGSGGGFPMIDGTKVYIPNYAAFDENGWLIEGVGAVPDVEVDQDPAKVLAGADPQLDRAIELLKARLLKEPIRRIPVPAFPKKG